MNEIRRLRPYDPQGDYRVLAKSGIRATVGIDTSLLKFRCTGCGNCCRDPLLPITDRDLRRLVQHTGVTPSRLVRWCSKAEIDLDDEPENFVHLPAGKRVMTLRHSRSGCVFLGADQHCTVYSARPQGCRVFPFDTKFARDGKLRRLELIPATECPYEQDGKQSVKSLRVTQEQFACEVEQYQAKIAAFNQLQQQRKRKQRPLLTVQGYFDFLGIS